MQANKNKMLPAGVTPVEGIVHRRSPYSVDETVAHLVEVIRNAGALVFAVVDHSGEAQKFGQALRDTKLLTHQVGLPG